MSHERIEHEADFDEGQHEERSQPLKKRSLVEALPRLRATLAVTPDVRAAYFQPGPADGQLCLSGPERARVMLVFNRKVSAEHIEKRLERFRRQFAMLTEEETEFIDIEQLHHREACEIAFNAQVIYGGLESVERDRLYRYNVFLEWNAGRRNAGAKQELPPVLVPSLDRPTRVVSIAHFITPLYRHLKMIEGHLREMRRLMAMELHEFSADSTHKSLAESYMLKGIQSSILITMSVMHRKMRLSARDYRDLFLMMSVFGLTNRDRAARLAKCADLRDRLMFQYDDISVTEVYQYLFEVTETLADFKIFMLDWLFEQYYGPSGEVIQHE